MSARLALAAASPLRIDSTEQIARAILWVTAEHEWPHLPIQTSVKNAAKAWPELSSRSGVRIAGDNLEFCDLPSDSLFVEAEERARGAKQRFQKAVDDRGLLKDKEAGARGNRRVLAEVNLQKKELIKIRDQEEESMHIHDEICRALESVSQKFRMLQRCPCCTSNRVERAKGSIIVTCSDCGTEWGRRVCADCRRQYAFIVPHDPEVLTSAETFDSVRMFGADMCAEILPPELGSPLPRDTACPYCLDHSAVFNQGSSRRLSVERSA